MFWSRPDLQVLFVCTANICRSPLAEALLRHRLRAMGLARKVQVGSAGTRAGQRGLRPDRRVEALAAEAGVSLGRIRSRMLTPGMIRNSDYLLVMDRTQLEDVNRLSADLDVSGPEPAQLLGSFIPGIADVTSAPEIPDPYFGDLQGFRHVHAQIDAAVTGLLTCIESRLAQSSGDPQGLSYRR